MKIEVNGRKFEIVRLLGKGKGGCSFLVADGDARYVVKQIHDEACAYYRFGDKPASELRDYEKLKGLGVPMPALIDADVPQERILKEYIEGETIYELVRANRMKPAYLEQMRALSERLRAANVNIDYFPTNFVVRDDRLWYVDFGCNDYMEEWSFENWGAKYWSRTPEFEAHEQRNSG